MVDEKTLNTLSKKQFEFLVHSTAQINLAHGSVRSGKTYSTLLRFAEGVITCPDEDIMIVGRSLETIYYNIVKPFMEGIGRGMCSWRPGAHVLNFANKNIRLVGAHDQGAVGSIQGTTLSLVYVDEMTILPDNVLEMLYTRLSRPHSQLIGTMNPDSPFHPIKKLIDEADGKKVYALHFRLEDNPSLTKDYKDLLDRLYSGLWRRRFVLGEWCLAEGAIYDFFDRKFHVVSRPPTFAKYYIVGIDYGTSNPFAMVLIGVNGDVHPGLWVEKEYYYDPKEMGKQRTDSEFADAVEMELAGYPVRVIYLDPSAQSMEVELKKRRKNVRQAENDVLNGIRTVSNFMSQGDLVICNQAQNLIKEIESYTWDPKKVKLGQDAPIKARDHACDALRYALFTHFGTRTILKETPKADPFKNPDPPPGWGGQPYLGGTR